MGWVASFRRALLAWYDQNRRELPWRRDRDPYRVWVSEIMLQQTRVAAVLEHYARFLKRFPTVQALASAREASVLAIWSGLGYYHRARRMHQAAKIVVRERDGRFPQTAEEWVTLPGIGRYTASAVASIAFGETVAVVDGNVERVLQRLFGNGAQVSPKDGRTWGTEANEGRTPRQALGGPWGMGLGSGEAQVSPTEGRTWGTGPGRLWGTGPGREAAWRLAEALLDPARPGDFNQAMMELGATICTPRAPQCLVCPVNAFCVSRGAGIVPTQAPRKRKAVNYALVRQGDSTLLARRAADSSLMAGMWELPGLDPDLVNGDEPLLRVRHSITDTDYRVAVYSAHPDKFAHVAAESRWFTRRQRERLPLTGLTRKILRRLEL
jgi:A/G-specific adenine glycosylase